MAWILLSTRLKFFHIFKRFSKIAVGDKYPASCKLIICLVGSRLQIFPLCFAPNMIEDNEAHHIIHFDLCQTYRWGIKMSFFMRNVNSDEFVEDWNVLQQTRQKSFSILLRTKNSSFVLSINIHKLSRSPNFTPSAINKISIEAIARELHTVIHKDLCIKEIRTLWVCLRFKELHL